MRRTVLPVLIGLALVLGLSVPSWAVISKCEECHAKLTPLQVEDFNRSKMSQSLDCTACHGEAHQGMHDAAKATLPTMKTCAQCHEDQVKQYRSGKHALGLIALNAMPYTHMQPKAFVDGQKGCGGCHTLGLIDEKSRLTEGRRYYKYGMDCQNCHTRHAFSKAEAAEPEACQTCHTGFDHAQWEMWSGSKHGVTYLLNRIISPKNKNRAPKCQTCHMPDGDHRVMSAWGFLAVRLPEKDREWMKDRVTILQGLGVLDSAGKPTARLEIVKAGKVARLSKEEFDAERNRIAVQCLKCHSKGFTQHNLDNADKMLREADKLFAEAITIVNGLYRDRIITNKDGRKHLDLLTFYDVNTKIEEVLYEMFMDHRMKTFQASFHMNPDYATWYGFAKMKKDLVTIKELAAQMRNASGN